MYKDMKRIIKDGYVYVNMPEHPRAIYNSGRKSEKSLYVAEHILVAEEILDRPLREGEVVHHLDLNKTNNSHDNLLPTSNPMHSKLHGWLEKHQIIPNEQYRARMERGCVRCKVCERPVYPERTFCSLECTNIDFKANGDKFDGSHKHKKIDYPDTEELKDLVSNKSLSSIAKDIGVNRSSITDHCKKLGVELPPQGHWSRANAGLVFLPPEDDVIVEIDSDLEMPAGNDGYDNSDDFQY